MHLHDGWMLHMSFIYLSSRTLLRSIQRGIWRFIECIDEYLTVFFLLDCLFVYYLVLYSLVSLLTPAPILFSSSPDKTTPLAPSLVSLHPSIYKCPSVCDCIEA